MTKQELYAFLASRDLAVLATIDAAYAPEAALVAFAVTPDLEIVFDTVKSSRKYLNLVANPRVALVIGWDDEVTMQYEGEAEPARHDDREIYFRKFPDGRDRLKWPGIVHFKIRPRWIRYCDYKKTSERIFEMTF
ncbi:MAG TPA: pyridoxamine 5'-phosphate oxidase family protein [Bryobacteraceae bacterium]|nr:pyridoxamine 5'-phosphate oxidase family protein [Bryobacteraceae bacterium]